MVRQPDGRWTKPTLPRIPYSNPALRLDAGKRRGAASIGTRSNVDPFVRQTTSLSAVGAPFRPCRVS